MLHALAIAQLVDYPQAVREAYGALLDIRGELHRRLERDEDVLRQQEQPELARTFGLCQRRRGAAPGQRSRTHDRASRWTSPGAGSRSAADPCAHCRHAGYCREHSAELQPIAHRSPRTSSPRTARWCLPGTQTRGPTRCW